MNKQNADNSLVIKLKSAIYPLEAIYGAAYVFIDRAYIYIDSKQKGTIEVRLKGKNKLNEKKSQALEGEFMNELLNYVQRLNISNSTKKIREFIVERALYSAISEEKFESNDADFDDPLGIAIPWEEKYGDQKNEK